MALYILLNVSIILKQEVEQDNATHMELYFYFKLKVICSELLFDSYRVSEIISSLVALIGY